MKTLFAVAAAALSALFLSTASVQACPPQVLGLSSCQQGYSAPLAIVAPTYYAPQALALSRAQIRELERQAALRAAKEAIRAQQFRAAQLNDYHAPAQQIVIVKERQPFRDAFRAFRGN